MDENNRPENPRAFPNPVLSDIKNCNIDLLNDGSQYGLTIRDYFAAKALQGMLSTGANWIDMYKRDVKFAYKIADAMLKERKQYEQREEKAF